MTTILDIENHKATITFNRPEASNSVSRELLSSFLKNLQEVAGSNAVRVLFLQASGEKVFCAGADLKERATMNEKEVIHFLDMFRYTCNFLENLPFPTVAVLNGDAYGGGLEIALCCDIRIMANESKIGLTETKLGIIPGAGGTQRLSRLIGVSRAMDLIFTGRRIDSNSALALGLVNFISDRVNIFEFTRSYAEEISASAPIAVRMAKKAIKSGLSQDLNIALDMERACYLQTLKTKDRNEALTAFKEKRKPNFIGE
ncbi:MAG: enoyl-CoA hydratase/isomerase family protein [Leptospiraceae bacterium]|nr:enoyl-CoA hydratase/isomerase family protein [Leptospiraceae bacterium]